MSATLNHPAPHSSRKLLSVVLPAFNEQEVLPQTYTRLTTVGQQLLADGMDYELIFVNDGSRDSTADVLNGFAKPDRHVRAVHLTRNFGHQAALTAGLTLARGDVIAVLDCDLQDPPELLPQFLARWREGFQVVFAIRKKRKEWLGKRLAYWAFYRLLAAISDLPIPLDSGDFCVMDRHALNLLNSLPERQRFVRGLRTWIGLRQTGVAYDRDARQAGRPAYTFRGLVRLAMDGLVSFSSVPLRWVTRLGILSALAAVFLLLIVVFARTFIPGSEVRFPWGWSSTACLILLTSSIQLLSLGIIGEYLARIFLEVKGRPTFLIADIVEEEPLDATTPAGEARGRRTPPFHRSIGGRLVPEAAPADPEPSGVGE